MTEHRIRDGLALTAAMVFPLFLTVAYFVCLTDAPRMLQPTVYAVGKTAQFGFPIVWVGWVLREGWNRFRLPSRAVGEQAAPCRQGWTLVAGLLFGLLIAGFTLALYHGALKPAGLFDSPQRAASAGVPPLTPAQAIHHKLAGFGINTLGKYVALALFYSVAHSFLEEYYWRWFVFGRLRLWLAWGPAVTCASLAFMAHHVVVLGVYFGWGSPWAYLFSLGVAVGGGVWAWLYERSGSLAGPWLSHLLVDAGIFAVGYDVARELF